MKSATRCSAARRPVYAPCKRTNEPGTLTGSTPISLTAMARLLGTALEQLRAVLLADEVALEGLRAVRRRPLLGRLQVRRDLGLERGVGQRRSGRRRRDLVDARLREHDHLSNEVERQRAALALERAGVRGAVLVHVADRRGDQPPVLEPHRPAQVVHVDDAAPDAV